MPVFNEENSLEDFIKDLVEVFASISFLIVVVNDASSDNTQKVIENLVHRKFPIVAVASSINMGHGKASILGMKHAVKIDSDFILTVDGDGNVKVNQLFEMLNLIRNNDSIDLIEGIRVNREDPWFRKLVSWITRKIVHFAAKSKTKDANTPVKIYRKKVLKMLLNELPQDTLIPNIRISILVRSLKYKIMIYELENMIRNTSNISGTTWGQKNKNLPSRKFIVFCYNGGKEVMKLLRNSFFNSNLYR
jgi:glycosyltransferase involved in cell wall biosynthesis